MTTRRVKLEDAIDIAIAVVRELKLRKELEELAHYKRAVAWANGETVPGVESFQPREPGDPPYWWRRRMNEIARGSRPTLTAAPRTVATSRTASPGAWQSQGRCIRSKRVR